MKNDQARAAAAGEALNQAVERFFTLEALAWIGEVFLEATETSNAEELRRASGAAQALFSAISETARSAADVTSSAELAISSRKPMEASP